MSTDTDNLTRFFDAISSLSFWRRIFHWKAFRALSYEAFGEFRGLRDLAARQTAELDQLNSHLSILNSDLDHLRAQQQFLEKERGEGKMTIDQLREAVSALNQELTVLRERGIRREEETAATIASLNAIRQQFTTERAAELDARDSETRERTERMKRTWQDHELTVREHLKLLCQRHTIEYVDVVPFRGSPDNTILIADEYVIFDAKSPASDDLRSFPSYLKAQAEAAHKYVKEERVRREIFLVIPSSTLPFVPQYVHHFAEHTVYIVSVDALEPIILAMRRIQEYEFAEGLSPEDRENIIRIVGRFAHITKRRIQVDQFFDRQFLQALAMTETELQQDMLSRVQEFERTLKLNPPPDQRLKLISREELERAQELLMREGEGRGIPAIQAPGETGSDTTEPGPPAALPGKRKGT